MSNEPFQAYLESDLFETEQVQIVSLTGTEAISQLFDFEVEIATEPEAFAAVDAIGAQIDLVLTHNGAEIRRIHAVITAVEDALETEASIHGYRLRLGPLMARLSLIETQDVFVGMSVPDIIKDKLGLVGLGEALQMRLIESYPAREFVVQYRESDLAFVSRLAEHLGICFFFEQGEEDHIVFTDHPAGFGPLRCPEGENGAAHFRPRGEHRDVFELSWRGRMMPKSWAVQDYDYRTPNVELTGLYTADSGTAGGVVEFASNHETVDAAERLARIRAEERAAQCQHFGGASALVELTAGAVFSLSGHPRLDSAELLVVRVTHALRRADDAAGFTYDNHFVAVPAAGGYRPPRITPRPRIHGVLAGHIEPVADGAVGDVAPRDDLGRYIVKFSFDPAALEDRPRSSLPIRMIHPHGGPGYGIQMPLETGMEVLIVFIDGDPDRPLIAGAATSPISPPPVRADEHFFHRIRTKAGIEIEMKDHF